MKSKRKRVTAKALRKKTPTFKMSKSYKNKSNKSKGFEKLQEHIQGLRIILNEAKKIEDLVILWDFGMELKIVSLHKTKLILDKKLKRKRK